MIVLLDLFVDSLMDLDGSVGLLLILAVLRWANGVGLMWSRHHKSLPVPS